MSRTFICARLGGTETPCDHAGTPELSAILFALCLMLGIEIDSPRCFGDHELKAAAFRLCYGCSQTQTEKAPKTTASTIPIQANTVAARFLRCSRSEEHTSELQSLAYLVCRL